MKAYASLAAELAVIRPADGNFPDITVELRDDQQIDFELAEWLDEHQTGPAKKRAKLRDALRHVLSSSSLPEPRNFKWILVSTRELTSFQGHDSAQFVEEFAHLVAWVDQNWPSEMSWHYPIGHIFTDFTQYPILAKYAHSTHFWPRNPAVELMWNQVLEKALKDPQIVRPLEELTASFARTTLEQSEGKPLTWIHFENEGGAYSSESAIQALSRIIRKKLGKYQLAASRDQRLIVYDDQAVLYNTPFYDLKFRHFADVARQCAVFVSDSLAGSSQRFRHVYLLKALWPTPEAYQLWPNFCRCQ